MSKVFKPFHTVSEYETTKISIDQNNTSYIYGNNLFTVYDTDLSNGIPKDLVSYNTICFVDDTQEIYRNGLNFSGQGNSYSGSKYLPYDKKNDDGDYYMVEKRLNIGNIDTFVTIGIPYNSDKASISVYENGENILDLSYNGIAITHSGTKYTLDFDKMIELGIMTPANVGL